MSTLLFRGIAKKTKSLIWFFAIGLTTLPVWADSKVVIGSGSISGVYFPTAAAICQFIQLEQSRHGLGCKVEQTGGAIENIKLLRSHKLPFALIQSDLQVDALQSEGVFEGQPPLVEMKSLFSLYGEALTLLVRSDAGIENIDDLRGRRVNLGAKESGSYVSVMKALNHFQIPKQEIGRVYAFPMHMQSHALCRNKVDALVFFAAHQNASTREATQRCGAVLVPITGKKVEELVFSDGRYEAYEIPDGMYKHNDHATLSYASRALLVAHKDVPDEVVYEVVKATFENFSDFKKLHPAFENLSKSDAVSKGLVVPHHAGAKRYFREVGLLR